MRKMDGQAMSATISQEILRFGRIGCVLLAFGTVAGRGDGLTISSVYDSSRRLTTVVYGQDAAIYYQYDASGNRTNQIMVGQANPKADYNANGLYDLWELTYFGNLLADPQSDPDQDSANNVAESQAWTNPLDAASNLHFTSATNTPSGFALEWEAHANAAYRVWWSDDLRGWQATNSVVVPSGSYVDTSPASSQRFYRVSVEP